MRSLMSLDPRPRTDRPALRSWCQTGSALLTAAVLLTACKSNGTAQSGADGNDDKPSTNDGTAVQSETHAPMGQWLEQAKLPPTDILGKPPAEVEGQLGEVRTKGMARESCVRFVPERTWFSCSYAWQSYDDPTGTYRAIQVTYEDGKATGVTYDGIPGEGAFDPNAALAFVGVQLPGEPDVDTPATDVKTWSWFNDKARLRHAGEQYRVLVSVKGDGWTGSKVELIANSPLSPQQRARIKQPGKNEAESP